VKDIFSFFEKPKDPVHFNAVQISLASPERIREWSNGEVKKPETINYRTFKPEKEGLFCARIFGPVKDYECICGKYKRMKHRGIVCEKCGVEVIQAKVRRERLGHINLATPVAHIWFLKSLPSRIGNLLDIPLKDLEKVLYCVSYVVLDPKETDLLKGEVLSEQKYYAYLDQFGPYAFDAGMGAEAIRRLLAELDIEHLSEELRIELRTATSEAKKKRLSKRLKVVEAFRTSSLSAGNFNRPEWMVLEVIPVLPPDLRPLVALEAGRFATSDLNDLYRRVINRNNRLQRLLDLNAPDIIIRNEKRMLQEAVDALFDNGKRGKTITGPNKRPLKSLSDMLRGKHGRFRQNLLGKRVDYSGRSVIVAGPELRLHQCGLPKKMALELFKPFIFHKLEQLGHVSTIKSAKKMVEREEAEVWDILDDVIKEHPVLLNRAPTLHRLGIQAFEPVLIEGKAIQVHPLVCTAFNADFDGDQMAVHVPLSVEAQVEARVLLLSTNNILSPANGRSIISPSQDIVLGCYWMTRDRPFAQGEGMKFANPDEVRCAYDHGQVHLQARITCRVRGERCETTVGRVLFSEILPDQVPFSMVNKTLKKGDLQALIDRAYQASGEKDTVIFADRMRTLGYTTSTVAGITVSLSDMIIPSSKERVVEKTRREVLEFGRQMQEMVLSAGEKYNKVVDTWNRARETLLKDMTAEIRRAVYTGPQGEQVEGESFNSIYIMKDSGARGSEAQLQQLSCMRGLMSKPSGDIIETPIVSSFREGLSGLEYFISTHGARKGLADTALKTANSGYMTRRLVDVAQDAIISEIDCGTLDGVETQALFEDGDQKQSLSERIVGRVTLEPVFEPNTGELLVDADQEITEEIARLIEESAILRVTVRSPLTCQSVRGLCAKCYGRDLARGRLVNVGEAVGVIAAQSIGEPGTQLTMRTFHAGGIGTLASGDSNIKTRYPGFVRYEDVRRVRRGNHEWVVMGRSGRITVVDGEGRLRQSFPLVQGATLLCDDNEAVAAGAVLASWDAYSKPILATLEGTVRFEDIVEGVTADEKQNQITGFSQITITDSRDGSYRPRLVVKGKDSRSSQTYLLQPGTVLEVSDKQEVVAGTVLAKTARESQKTKDITGGLPRVAELFEARKPKEMAVVSKIDGEVSFGRETKGKRIIHVTPPIGEREQYAVPKGKYIQVQEGDQVSAGDDLTDGYKNPHDILEILGRKHLANYIVDNIQQVYRQQGVRIHDKHIEVIVRQMLRRVRVEDPGDTQFLADQTVERLTFEEENENVRLRDGLPATAQDLLLGITKAALSTESWISASSFQETTKVLTEAAIHARVDYLRGLKENVIMGRLIPAGTGLPAYRDLDVRLAPDGRAGLDASEPVAVGDAE
jgi:DNA-directed RNA polymerase subunit beta'